MVGTVTYFNDWAGPWALIPGFALIACTFFGWFHSVIGEDQSQVYNSQVDRSFRMGMMWFIFSEVMSSRHSSARCSMRACCPPPGSAAAQCISSPNILLWPHYDGTWPTNGPGHVGGHLDGTFETVPAFSLPAINTLILLTSGVTVTIAHHALRSGKRGVLKVFLALTFPAGIQLRDAAGPRVR